MDNPGFFRTVEDYAFFRKMLAPLIIKALCWPLMAFCFIGGLVAFYQGRDWGLWLALAAPLAIRISFEIVILQFKMYAAQLAILDAVTGRAVDVRLSPVERPTAPAEF